MKRRALLTAALLAVSALAVADVVTLPAAASIVGGAPFFSDVRVFNTSYASPLAVTATYRCFIATASCPASAPQIQFTLAPRESRAFNDICAGAFGSPNTAGGVEFEVGGSEDQMVVTSRLYSTSPYDSVGMFIPGLRESKAAATTILTSIRHDPGTTPPSGFRSNVGVFNPGSSGAGVTFAIFDAGAPVGTPVARSVPAHSGVQVSGIFEAAGLASLSTQNAVIVVTATTPVFSYAAVIDNATTDPIFVLGAPDIPTTPTATYTPTQTPTVTQTPTITQTATVTQTATITGTPTLTPTATNTITPRNTRTPTPNPNHIVAVGVNGFQFVDAVSLTFTTTIKVGETVEWDWSTGPHSTTSGNCVGVLCTPDLLWDSQVQSPPFTYTRTFADVGTFAYYDSILGPSMTGVVVVNPQ